MIPRARIVRGGGGEPAPEIGRRGFEDEPAAGERLPLARVVPAEELAADLDVVLRLVNREVVPRRERILEELLRVVARLPDREVRKHVVRRVRERRHRQQVLPVELAVAELELPEHVYAEDARPAPDPV